MLLPKQIVDLILADPELKLADSRMTICLVIGSVVFHAQNFVDAEPTNFEIRKRGRKPSEIRFPTKNTAQLVIDLPFFKKQFHVFLKTARPTSSVERVLLWTIAVAHNAAAESLTHKYFGEFTASFLERMDDVIASTAINWLVDQQWKCEVPEESVSAIRQFMEKLMAASYEGHAAEIAVSVVNKNRGGNSRVKLDELLVSKKTSALFAGHRQVLLCNLHADAFRQVTLPPYPDVKIPSKGGVYAGPYEYQPVLRFSDKQNALTFLLSRRREVTVVLGPVIVFTRDYRGWHLFPTERFLDLLGELLYQNAKRKLSRKGAHLLAIQLGMISLTLRHRGKGALIVVQRPGSAIEASSTNSSPAEIFYQSILRDQWLLTAPVSLMCNAAAIDGATILTCSGEIKQFGIVINTEHHTSESEGARTRAAEYASSMGVVIKVSEDGPITLFSKGRAMMTLG